MYHGAPKIALMTAQHDRVNSGPGTFVKYLKTGNRGTDLTFFSEDVEAPGQRKRKVSLTSLGGLPGRQFVRLYEYHRAFAEANKDNAFDLLWYTAPILGFFSAVLKTEVPVVLMVNDYSNAISRRPFESRRTFGTWTSFARSVWRLFEKRTLHSCDAIVVNSRFTKRKLIDSYDLPENKLHLLYKAVDIKEFTFQPSMTIDEPVRVLFMKTDYRRGGLEEVAAAMSSLPFEAQLTVAGSHSDQSSELRTTIHQSGYKGKVRFCGRVPREHVPELFQEHDVLCVPSRAEALGVVFLEALASGVPAIGGEVGGIPEVLNHGRAGWLAKPFDVADVRRQLIEVVEDKEIRRQKIERGRVHVRRFSVSRMTSRFGAIARNVIEQ